MTGLDTLSDELHRLVKIALDTGEASTIDEATRIFAGYRIQIALGPEVAANPVMQAAALTAVNCGVRSFLGGVTVFGAAGPLRVKLPFFSDMPSAVAGLGGHLAEQLAPDVPTLVIGDVESGQLEPLALRATFNHWCGGVVPAANGTRLAEAGPFTPAGVLAGALGVAEIFQRLRGGLPIACRRHVGLDLWQPERDWRRGGDAAPLDRLPSRAWLVGMGNLGQAYLWTLGLLPYADATAEFVLQDTDTLSPSNLSTSMLTSAPALGQRKTRAMAAWAEARGFKTALIERPFAANFKVDACEPPVALIGVDNALARQAVEAVGFERIIEAGLGRGPQDFLGIDLHTFPASKPAREVWQETAIAEGDIAQPAYAALLDQSKDRCGIVRLAGRSIGAPFVGAVAASLVVAELVRLCLGGCRYEFVSLHLRELAGRTAVQGKAWEPHNPGSIKLAA